MSHHSDTGSAQLEEDEEAFLDLEDPENQILDDDDDEARPQGQEGDGADDDDDGDEDGRGGEEEVEGRAGVTAVDLNTAPDIEPERDDSVATFVSDERKPLHVVRLHPSNPTTAAASGEGEEVYVLRIGDDARGALAPIAVLKGHTDTVTKLEFSPNGEVLASGSMDTTVKLWCTTSWTLLHSLSDLSGEVETLLWHPSSLALVAGGADAQAALWNAKKGTLAVYFVGHRLSVTCATWSSDVKRLVTASADGTIIVFNPKVGEQMATIAKDLSPDNAGITALEWVSDDVLLAGCEDGTLHLVSVGKAKVVTHLVDVHEQAIESIAVNISRTLYATTSCDCQVVVWNAQDHTVRVKIDVGESVIPARWVEHFLVAGCSDGAVRVWDGRSSRQEPVFSFLGHQRMIIDFAVDVVRQRLVTASDDGMLKVFTLQPDGNEASSERSAPQS